MRTIPLLFLGLLAIGSSTTASADINVSLSADIRLGRVVAPPPPAVEVVEVSGPKGPPPWAHRSWFRRDRVYYFYPEASVYYRPADRTWFYLDGGAWRFGVELPSVFSVDLNHCVSVTMTTDRPWEYHRDIVVYYPSNYFAKVRLVKESPGRGEPSRGKPHDDDDDRGKGHGRGKSRNH